jgi:hypothetical protein
MGSDDPFQNTPPMPRSEVNRTVYSERPVDPPGYHYGHHAVVPNNFRMASYLETGVVSV